MKVLVLIDTETAEARDPQFVRPRKPDPAETERNVVSALRQCGHQVTVLPFERYQPAMRAIAACGPDLVFNLTEHVGGDRRKDARIASLLDRLGLRYTGAGPQGLGLGRDKGRSKRLIERAGFCAPAFEIFGLGKKRFSRPMQYPVLVKPLMLDASEQMARNSLVANEAMALDRVAFIHRHTGQPAICEQFIDGRELKLAILGNRRPLVFPPREVVFGRAGTGGPRFITSRVKNDPNYRRAWKISYPRAELSNAEVERIAGIGVKMYRVLKMRDYGKIDVRVTPDGRVFFLEANPNPDLSPAGFGTMAAWGGVGFQALIGRIVTHALDRRS